MPYRRRRRWVKFVRRTQAVIDKGLAPSFFIRLKRVRVVTNANKQGVASIHTVLGNIGITSSGLAEGDLNDLEALRVQVNRMASDENTGAGPVYYFPDKFRVTGWLAETSIHNVGDNTAYIDMYYWKTKKDISSEDFLGQSSVDLAGAWSAALSRIQVNTPTGGSTLDIFDYGNTPFNNASLASYVTVYKKTRVKLAPGGITQVEQRGSRNIYFNYQKSVGTGHLRGITHGIFFVIYGPPILDFPTAAPVDLMFSTNINYTVRVMRSAATTGGTTQA